MACIRKRRGKYVVDGRDAFGVRKWVTCETKAEAERELGRLIGESQSPRMSSADRDMTVADLAERFLKTAEATTKPATQAAYTWAIDSYIVPALGSRKVRQLTRGHAKAFATELASKLQAKSTKNVLGVLHSMLEEAIEAEIVSHNVAARHGSRRSLARLFGPKPADLEERIKAFTREELSRLMGALSKHDPQWLPFFFAISRTGIRLGEAIGLRWDDLDFAGRKVRVARNVSLGNIETPKSGRGRTVDMSLALRDVLQRYDTTTKAAWLKRGKPRPDEVFPSDAGTHLDPANVRRVFRRALKNAGLPADHTPHDLRHTFASLLLQNGVSLAHVQRMLGHADPRLTASLYGKWLPVENPGAVDSLDQPAADPSGSKVVANTKGTRAGSPYVADEGGRGARIRTGDLLVPNQAL